MTRLLVPFLLLIVCACTQQPQKTFHFRDVSAPVKKQAYKSADTLPTLVNITRLPDDLWVLSTTRDVYDLDTAMSRLLVRMKDATNYLPKILPAKAAMSEGGLLHDHTFLRKTGYTTELVKDGKSSGEFISIGMEVLSFYAFGYDPDIAEKGRIASVHFPSGWKRVKIKGLWNQHNSREGISVTGVMRVKLSAMLRDGTYTEERLELLGVVGIPNDYHLQLKPL